MKNTTLKTISNIRLNLDFFEGFSKNPQISNFTKIRPVGTALIRADRQTDRPEEANSLFSLFVRRRLITRPNGNFWVEK